LSCQVKSVAREFKFPWEFPLETLVIPREGWLPPKIWKPLLYPFGERGFGDLPWEQNQARDFENLLGKIYHDINIFEKRVVIRGTHV